MRTTNLLALLLVACGSTADAPSTPTAPTAPAAPGTPGTESEPVCTQIGCVSGTTISLQIPAALAASPGSVIKTCFRERCATSPLPAANGPCQFAGQQPSVSACGVQAGVLKLTLTIPSTDMKDGDLYSLEVTDPSGQTSQKAMIERSVRYTKVEPNGPKCGPVCYQATIE